MARHVARTRALTQPVDPLAVGAAQGVVFAHPGRSLAGYGIARRLPVERSAGVDGIETYFAGLEVDDEVAVPGSGPVAIGALPFDPARPGSLVVPQVTVGHDDRGNAWVTTVGEPGDADDPVATLDALLARAPEAPPAPTTFEVHPDMDPRAWCEIVDRATEELRRGHHRKVVLARGITVTADAPFDRRAVLERLRSAYASCHLFAVDDFLGASPELLVARLDDVVTAHPMAGTAPRSTDPAEDARLGAELWASPKDREEHQITIDMVHDTLLPWCSYLDWEPEPGIAAMANVQHLATRMEGRLSDPPASVLELMAALHPTPAVCGHPRGAALGMIERLEALDRGCYGGPVGWVDGRGNGEWAVAIRSAHVDGSRARCYAGVGVVADSEPALELAETRVKFQAMLSALVQP